MATNVFIIPGFMGCRLRKVAGFGRVKDIWLNRTHLALDGPDDLDLAYPGPLPGPLANGPLTDFGTLTEGPYQALMTKLGTGPFIPNFFSYDWRLSIRTVAQQFVNTLNNGFKGKDFYVIGHSLGALVARWGYLGWLADNNAARWKRSIYLGAPHGGTYDALSALSGYQPDLSLTAFLATSVGVLVKRASNPTGPRRALQDRLNQVLASWPSLYQMMPCEVGPWIDLDEQLPAQSVRANFTRWNNYVTQARLDEGKVFRADLAGRLTSPRPAEVCVTGGPFETMRLLDDVDKFGEVGGYKFTAAGDGVVPDDRAQLPGVNTLHIETSHQQIPTHLTFLTRVNDLLLNGLGGSLVAKDPLPVPPPLTPPLTFYETPPLTKFTDLITRGDP